MATKAAAPRDDESTGLALLRRPFPAHQISKLPKPYKKDSPKAKCEECGSYHALPAMHLDYVGHAALTDRLLDADPNWSWEPMSLTTEGLPALDRNGGLWIRLTVCGVTRLGYGSADGKSGGDAIKELIGDALRNAAMRFGAALDLWHKGGDLHADDSEAEGQSQDGAVSPPPATDTAKRAKAPPLDGPYKSKTALWQAVRNLDRELRSCGDIDQLDTLLATTEVQELMAQCKKDAPSLLFGGNPDLPAEFEPINELIDRLRRELDDAAASPRWRANALNAG